MFIGSRQLRSRKSLVIEFEEVSAILSIKKKDLKQKGFGNKPNAAQRVEAEDIEKKCSPQLEAVFKIFALFSILYAGTMSRT